MSGLTRLRASAALAALLALIVIGCTSTPPQRTPPVGSLPDPVVIMPASALAALFGGATLGEPSCRYAESNYRCTWADAGSPARELTVTIYADTVRVTSEISRPTARSVSVPGAGSAAVVTSAAQVEAWAVVGERGLQLSFTPGAGDPAAHEAALLVVAAALAAAMGGG